jgi:hypothetical protein
MYTLEQGSTGVPPSVPFSQPKNLFRYGEQTLWSTQLHATAAGAGVNLANGTFRLFTTPIGQVGQGFTNALTIAETNLKEGGRIPNGIAFDVFGVACQVGTADTFGDTDLGFSNNTAASTLASNQILTNGIITWDFTQTQDDIAPINLIGAGGGAFGSVSVTSNAAATLGNLNNGAGSVWLYRKHPVALPGGSTFSLLLRYGNRMGALGVGEPSIFVKLVLMGYYKNVIEIG